MRYNSIGKIAAAHGIAGELVLKHALGKRTALKGLETIFIEVRKGELLPYFIQGARAKNEQEIYLQFDGIATRESAQKLVGKECWLPEEDFNRYAASNASISFLGYHIWHEGEDLGEILEVIEQPHQVLCRIEYHGKDALLPVHQDSLLEVDPGRKILRVQLPDGLLDIYR
ncbi:MAG TPA: ribosome maturation factor RimM [Flavihumibacter sp.]|jgi:16S rRNA processing protein RimM